VVLKSGPDAQGGSVLILILVAIGLFAALSYVMLREGGTGAAARTMSDAQARLAAAEIIAYGDALASAVQRLRLRGCSENEFDFANDAWTMNDGTPLYTGGHNPYAVPDCALFAGGHLRPVIWPDSYLRAAIGQPHNTKKGHARIIRASLPQVGEANKQEMLYRAVSIHRQICLKINDMLGVDNPDGELPRIGGNTVGDYHGIFGTSSPPDDANEALTGKTAFCTSSGGNSYYRVLIVR